MRSRIREAAAVAAVALLLTAALAASVLRAPSERVFGVETVGRHHDPFTVMRQFEHPVSLGLYSQWITDGTGRLIARVTGGVAAYNWLVLLSFPLAAAAAFLLARHIGISTAAATVAALAYAFSPFHLAHAAYHPHIAQTQWVPLYLLALWRCLDRATPSAVVTLAAAACVVTFSNFYGGLIAAVITPVAIGAYWFARMRGTATAVRNLLVTSVTLLSLAMLGLVYIRMVAPAVFAHPASLAFERSDLFKYSAKWWSYLLPPVSNPWLGGVARRLWTSAGMRDGMLEQQVSLGAGIICLGLVAVTHAVVRRSTATARTVFMLAAIAATALVCSLSPERSIAGVTVERPSALFYLAVPMFRAYARFGVVVQLMATLLAGFGLDVLFRRQRTGMRVAGVVMVVLAMAEYAVAPSALSRDVLPTSAHRWVMTHGTGAHVLDCTPLDQSSESVQWLTAQRVTMLEGPVGDCLEPHLAGKLAALEYTHILVRTASSAGTWFRSRPLASGLTEVAAFPDGRVFSVSAPIPAIYTGTMTGFWPREQDQTTTWRWMSEAATLTMVNTTGGTIEVSLEIQLMAFDGARHLDLDVDGGPPQRLLIDKEMRPYQTASFVLSPGEHALTLRAAERPPMSERAIHSGERRPLGFAVGDWQWNARIGHR